MREQIRKDVAFSNLRNSQLKTREKRQGKAILFEFSIFCVRKKRNIEQTKVAKWYYNVMKSIHKLLKAIFGTHGEIGKYL